jgi:hypothetical protein
MSYGGEWICRAREFMRVGFQTPEIRKTPGFSRNQGFCLLNVAVKERFETTRSRFLKPSPPVYKGCSPVVRVGSVPRQSHGLNAPGCRKRSDQAFWAIYVEAWEKGNFGNELRKTG